METDRKRTAARDSAGIRRDNWRSCTIEPLESRLFCDHAMAAAVVAPGARESARAVTVVNAGTTPATAQNVGALSATVSFRDTLTAKSLVEYFKFTVPGPCTVDMSLTSLTANADLQLIHVTPAGATQVVMTSAHPGKTNESIGKGVAAGTYYARVYETSGTAIYNLTLGVPAVTTKTPTPPTPPPAVGGKLKIVFDYSYDSSKYFATHPQAQTLLNLAAANYSKFTNVLSAITPGSGNTWSETFANPADPSQQITINNASVASNTIVIYVGASSGLQTSELGYGEPGGWNAMGTENWVNLVQSRGQSGALKDQPTAFSPWGGSISFSSTTNWNLSSAAPTSKQNDFLSVATHEIAHVLGFGTSPSWFTDVSGSKFIGKHAEAVNGGKAVPLAAGLGHWADGFMSTVNGTSQYAEMDPYLITGTRRALTALDYAGLEDLGWTV